MHGGAREGGGVERRACDTRRMPQEQCNVRRCIVPGAVYTVLRTAHCAHRARSTPCCNTPCCDLQCAVLHPVTRQRATSLNALQHATRCVATCFNLRYTRQPVMLQRAARRAATCNTTCCFLQHDVQVAIPRVASCNTPDTDMDHGAPPGVHRMQHATRNMPRTGRAAWITQQIGRAHV